MKNNKTNKLGYAWLIWGLTSSVFLVEYFARVAPGVMAAPLMQHFKANATMLGALSFCFYIGYISMQIPVGILVDRFSVRLLLGGSTIICGISAVVFSYANHIIQAELARVLMGLTAAFGFIGALKIAKVWFPATMIGLLAGGTQALGMFGAAVGEGPVAYLSEKIGWQPSMLLIGALILIIGIAIAIIVRDKKQLKVVQHKSLIYSLKVVLKNPVSWLNAVVIGTLYAPVAAFGELWGPSYVHQVYNLPMRSAAEAMSFIFIGWAVGSPIAGALSDKIKKRRPIIILSCLFSLITLLAVLYLPDLNRASLYIILFLFGLSNVGVAVNCAVAIEINSSEVAGTSLAFANMSSILIGGLLQPVIGFFLDQGASQSSSTTYSSADFHHAMLTLPICAAVSLAAAFLLPETFPKSK